MTLRMMALLAAIMGATASSSALPSEDRAVNPVGPSSIRRRSQVAPTADVAAPVSCGAGTSYVPATGSCTADCSANGTSTGHVYLAGIFHLSSSSRHADYTKHHFTLAVDLINNHSDGVWDDVLTDAHIEINMADSRCSAWKAPAAYWSMREWGRPLHGVIGCRCSGSSMAVASIAQIDQMPQISSSSTSPGLSHKEDFPYFFRTVTPDGPKGGVGAMVQLLRTFGWERVMVLDTTKPWAHDTSTQFKSLWIGEHNATGQSPAWTGQVSYSHTIAFGVDGTVDMASVAQAFAAMPVGNPSSNSRVIVLSVHAQDAWPILRHAAESGFQKDTIFVGPASWVGDLVPTDFTSIAEIPGYIGLTPFENPAPENSVYLNHLQQYEASRNMSLSTSISKYGAIMIQSQSILICLLATDLATPSGAETVDAVVAMAKALGSLPHSQRRNGTLVRAAIQNTSFAGVSGHVQFDANGDLMDPRYTVVNLGSRSPVTGKFSWTNVGSVGSQPGQSNIQTSMICWPVIGCGGAPPSDRPPSLVYLAGIFDLTTTVMYGQYIRHHFTLAVDLINNHSDGVWDDVLTDAHIEINMAD
eukprot:COSAG01_NODE_8862_length_2633_cov_4.164562_1_plen_584_part_10